MNRLSRRSALGAAVAAAVMIPAATSATVTPSPDAELIRLCGEYVAVWGWWNELCCHDHPVESPECLLIEAEQERVASIADPLLHQALALPCTTLAGFRALASALATFDDELLKVGPGDDDVLMTRNIVRRLLALENVA